MECRSCSSCWVFTFSPAGSCEVIEEKAMKRDNIFWGGVLILLGVLFLLQTQNIIPSVFPYLWPLALILIGGWMVLNVYWRPTPSDEDTFSMPLGEAKRVKYKFSHGAGEIEITGGAPMGRALVGSSAS